MPDTERFHNIGEESSQTCMGSVGVTSDGTVFPVRCKQWSCPVCAPINAYHCAIRVANGMSALYTEGVRCRFFTLTQPGSVKTTRFAYSIIEDQWTSFHHRWDYWARQLRKKTAMEYVYHCNPRLKRIETNELPIVYAAFVEGQERREGMPHFHAIGHPLPDIEILRKWAVKSGLGYQVDIQELKPGSGVAWYVSKYSTKSSDAINMPKGFHRVRFSDNWPRMLFRSDIDESTAVVKMPHESFAAWAIRATMVLDVRAEDTLREAQYIADGALQAEYSEAIAAIQYA